MFGKDSKKKELIANLGEIYLKIEKEHGISPGDFPNLAKMQVSLDISQLKFTDIVKSFFNGSKWNIFYVVINGGGSNNL